ncbi:5-formyltetrahydrofolate cyclo-ligase [Planctomycetales bacterium 10988]|nr:5-formyltetrahydrofolate cyclo-ligase [Planctomycetales bacterium 10988]
MTTGRSRKERLRAEGKVRRDTVQDRSLKSHTIQQKVLARPEVTSAKTILLYLSIRSEVTTDLLRDTWLADEGMQLVVPICRGPILTLFALNSMEELSRGSFGIPEPAPSLASLPERQVNPEALDVMIMPGLVFDPQGNRIGYGKGHFDRLLEQARPDVFKIGLAFEDQIVPHLEPESHDIPLDLILTEKSSYE